MVLAAAVDAGLAALLANVIALGTALLRAPRSALRLLAAPYNPLIAVTAYSIIVMAAGDASEEARFLISVLPLLAAAARHRPAGAIL